MGECLGADMDSLVHLLKDLGIFGIFISIFLENTGIPFPTEAAYIYAVVLIEQGHSYWLLLAILVAGHVIGSSAAYAMGYWGEIFLTNRFGNKEKFAKTDEWLHRWYSKYGAVTVFITRFVGYVRPWSSFIAGFAKINFLVFLFWTLLGSSIFTIILLEVTKRLIHLWHGAHGYLRVLMVIGFLVSIFMVYLVKIIWDRQNHRILPEPEAPPNLDEHQETAEVVEAEETSEPDWKI